MARYWSRRAGRAPSDDPATATGWLAGSGRVPELDLTAPARLEHVNLEVRDLARARRFYDRFLPVIGYRRLPIPDAAWLGYRAGRTTLWITVSRPPRVRRERPHVPSTGQTDPISDHLGFRVRTVRDLRRIEGALRRRGLTPVYATDAVPTYRSWYVSCAFADPDRNVLEIYAVAPRSGRTARPPGTPSPRTGRDRRSR